VINRTSRARVPVLGLALLATPTALSANSATTAIPELARGLGLTAADATWIATAFGWAAVLGAPLTASLLRAGGARIAVLVNAGLVVLGTLLVVVAPTFPVLLAGRAAQAVGGGGLVPLAIGLAATARRIGVISAGSGLVGAFGPLAGAALSEISWRLPLSLSLLAVLAVPVVLRRATHHGTDSPPAPVDVVGMALVMGLASALVLVSRFPVPAVLAAAVATVLLIRHIHRHPEGFVPRQVVRSRAFFVPTAVVCALSTSYFALLYTVPRLLDDQWSADRIGVATLVTLAAGSAASLLFTRWTARLGSSVTRAVVIAAGVVGVALPLITDWLPAYAAATAFAVFAVTAAMAWYAAQVGRAMPERHQKTALSLFTLCYQLGGAFGPALATVLIA
jgi:predicted MFS family arabinose efflux permease